MNKVLFKFVIAISIVNSYSIKFLFGNDRAKTKDYKNIVFILTDDQRFDDLGCTGNPVVKTPNIDRLAEEGILFENAYVTSAICTPSRASIFLSQHEREHGINFNSGTSLSIEAWEKSYPVIMRKAGYFTGYIGKNHVPVGEKGYQDSTIINSFNFWYAGNGHLTFYPKEVHQIFKNAHNDTQIEVLQEGVESFFNRSPKDQPFCLSIAFNLPHGSGVQSMKMRTNDSELYKTAYRDGEIDVSSVYLQKDDIKTDKVPKEVFHINCRQHIYDYVASQNMLKEITLRRYQTITGIDQFVGKVRELLREKGYDKNTVVVFTSDNGIMEGEYGLGGKALNYEGCVKIPFILYDPGLTQKFKGQKITEFIQTIDIAPTFLKYAGINIPKSMKGKPLQSLIFGKDESWRSAVFCENLWSTVFGNPRIESVREGKLKYIRYFKNEFNCLKNEQNPYAISKKDALVYTSFLTSTIKGEQPVFEELFDLDSDPLETINLADSPDKQKNISKLRKLCQELVTKAYGDGPKVVPYTNDLIQKWNIKSK